MCRKPTLQVKNGQRVEIVADAYPDRRFEGRVRLIAPEAVVEQNVTSFQVRVQLVSGQSELRSGMNVDVTFIGETVPDALVVPTVAIVTAKERRVCWYRMSRRTISGCHCGLTGPPDACSQRREAR